MLPIWILILCLPTSWASEEPFWKTKPKVYKRITDGDVIVVVKDAPASQGKPKNHLIVQGGGIVSAPAEFVFAKAQDFDQMSRVSGYIKSAKFDAKTEILELTVGAFGHEGKMNLKIKTKADSRPRRIDYEVVSGALQGLSGNFAFTELSAKKTEVGMSGDFLYDKFPIPQLFLEFGMEVAFQRMALRLRRFAEDEYRQSAQ